MRAGYLLFGFHDPEGLWVEYVQYMPDSLHSLDRGKHLGNRVSQQLAGIVLIARDPAATLAFYAAKLGLEKDQNRQPAGLRVPGHSGDKEIRPVGKGAKPRLVFPVEDVRRTAGELRHRGFDVRKEGGTFLSTTPAAQSSFLPRSMAAQSPSLSPLSGPSHLKKLKY